MSLPYGKRRGRSYTRRRKATPPVPADDHYMPWWAAIWQALQIFFRSFK